MSNGKKSSVQEWQTETLHASQDRLGEGCFIAGNSLHTLHFMYPRSPCTFFAIFEQLLKLHVLQFGQLSTRAVKPDIMIPQSTHPTASQVFKVDIETSKY
jgi:hypothetical protein